MKDYTYSRVRIANIAFLADQAKHEGMVDSKGISNEMTYDSLGLLRYQEQLQYVPMAVRRPDRTYDIADRVRKMVDQPYLDTPCRLK